MRRGLADEGLSAEDVDDLLEGVRPPRALHATLGWYRATFWDGLRGRLPRAKVEAPTLVVWGDKEQHLNAALADPPEGWVSNARVVHIAEASHWVHHDAPDKVAALLIEHFVGPGRGDIRATSVGDRANGWRLRRTSAGETSKRYRRTPGGRGTSGAGLASSGGTSLASLGGAYGLTMV